MNNRPVGPFMHRLSGFVHQDDIFDGTLTVFEHLTFIVSIEIVSTPFFLVCTTKLNIIDLF